MFKITFEGNSKFPVPNFYVYISHLRHSLVDAFYERTVVRGWKQHSNLFVSGFFFIIINCVQCLVTFDSSSPMLQSETRVSKNCPPCQHKANNTRNGRKRKMERKKKTEDASSWTCSNLVWAPSPAHRSRLENWKESKKEEEEADYGVEEFLKTTGNVWNITREEKIGLSQSEEKDMSCYGSER